MAILQGGTKLKAVHMPDGRSYMIDTPTITGQSKSITVSMEYGQMSGVPWAKIEMKDDVIMLVNLAQCDCVELLQETQPCT